MKHVKVKIHKTQQNNGCRLCGNRNETIYHIISEYNYLAQREYKTRKEKKGDPLGIVEEV